MKRKDKTEKLENLEERYLEVFKGGPLVLEGDDISLEQPYVGRIVDSVTTYSVYGQASKIPDAE